MKKGILSRFIAQIRMKRRSILSALICLLCTPLFFLAGQSAEASYLPPAWHGIHHCMLMYPVANRSTQAMKPYVVKMVDGVPQPNSYLFDSFVFLRIVTDDGIQTDSGITTMAHWSSMLDRFFDPQQDIRSLDTAIGEIAAVIGPPPNRRKVFIGIPWPNPQTTNFGDVDHDGVSENFSSAADREKAVAWYIDEACRRWAAASYSHLDLAGFYWIREENNLCVDTTWSATQKVHSLGMKMLWIPYFRAPGTETAYDYFDIVVMQPNYAFNSWMDGGADRPVKLIQAARDCAERSFGMEIECRSSPPNAYDGAIFRRYLAYGAASRLGYQQGINAYFLNESFVEDTYNTPYEAYYHDLCQYVLGQPVADPDAQVTGLTVSGSVLTGRTNTGSAAVSYVDMVVDSQVNPGWRGLLVAELKQDGGSYVPAGWCVVTEDSGEDTGCFTIPVQGAGDALRITAYDWLGTFQPSCIRSIHLDTHGPRTEANACLGKPYTVQYSPAARSYPDNPSNSKLKDGIIGQASWPLSHHIGWWGSADILIDLGTPQPITDVELYLLGGGQAGIQFPLKTRVTFASDRMPASATGGAGPLPSGFGSMAGGIPVISQTNGSLQAGVVHHPVGYTATARYLYVSLEASGAWTMLSEIKVKNGQADIPLSCYTLKTLPTSTDGAHYADTGESLTDGMVSQVLDRHVMGWASWEQAQNTVTVDLGSATDLSAYRLYALGGGQGGVCAPAKVEFAVSGDGITWQSLGTVHRPTLTEDNNELFPVEYALSAPAADKRYLRATVTASGGWCMISEIQASP